MCNIHDLVSYYLFDVSQVEPTIRSAQELYQLECLGFLLKGYTLMRPTWYLSSDPAAEVRRVIGWWEVMYQWGTVARAAT